MQAWPAFLRVASKGVYAGGGSIAEGRRGRKRLGHKVGRWLRGMPSFTGNPDCRRIDSRLASELGGSNRLPGAPSSRATRSGCKPSRIGARSASA